MALSAVGFAIVYAMRVNMNVALVAMVNNTAVAPHILPSDVCPAPPIGNTTNPNEVHIAFLRYKHHKYPVCSDDRYNVECTYLCTTSILFNIFLINILGRSLRLECHGAKLDPGSLFHRIHCHSDSGWGLCRKIRR